jgi:NADH-quinone oxidoreductase subunit M
MNLPLLSLMTFLPLIGAAAVLLTPRARPQLIKNIALVTTGLSGLFSILLLSRFDASETRIQFVEKFLWIPEFPIHYFLAVDGINLPMVLLTALISLLACIASFGIKEREKEYFFLFLVLETGIMGTFLALDLFLFYIFWEAVLIPMYFLIGIWGGARREYAAIKFFLYTLGGSLFMLLGILTLYFYSTPHSFDWTLLKENNLSLRFQQFAFVAFFFGFAIKVPVFPFHTWLPDAHVEAPTPISVLLAGVLLKMGAYGLLRFSFPLFPDAAQFFAPTLSILGVIGIVYGGLVALAQNDFKKMIAYSSVSHMGFVLLGLASLNLNGFNGALLQMTSHGLITAGLFLLVGVLYDRSHLRDIYSFGGLQTQMPFYAGLLIFFSLASLGLPTMSGFVSEFLILLGAYEYHPALAAISCLGLLLAATYLLLTIRRILHGPLNQRWNKISDISAREIGSLLPLVALILILGLYPKAILHLISPSLANLLSIMLGTS